MESNRNSNNDTNKGTEEQVDYNATLKLPKTGFKMKASAAQVEPKTLQYWEDNKVYDKMVQRNLGKTPFVLHDGPPYANGNIHLGTALNKTLKDFVVKYKNMSGKFAPYVPGWDTHGLPIELKVLKNADDAAKMDKVKLRQKCAEYAKSQVKNQMEQFKRLGSLGDYSHPYLTLLPEFESEQVKVFGKMMKKGHVYKGLKPVYWCPDCMTALAEAEVEYSDDPCHSLFIKFGTCEDNTANVLKNKGLNADNTYFVVWTTTPWTIPGNLAVCLGPAFEYSVLNVNNENYVVATELVSQFMNDVFGEEEPNYSVVATVTGAELEGVKTKHPLFDRLSPVIVGNHVTLETGTGCVHTAPGYGVEDFEVCKNYPELGVLVCVDDKGRQTKEAGEFEGMDTDTANKAVSSKLDEVGALLKVKKLKHKYPHCWRCKNPIIFRATEQWFCRVSDFKKETVDAVGTVTWLPDWGKGRMENMVTDRSDWCISRQRTWGVPIPVFYCEDCGEVLCTPDTIDFVANTFKTEGSDSWWKKEATELMPVGTKCKCGCTYFRKETNIMDVWFDSGVSHTAVLNTHKAYESLRTNGERVVADLYLEGADQYRGWFQSSLLTSVVYNDGKTPYKAVSTHGWVVDGKGRAMHKSLGNGIAPQDVIKKYSAEVLRLWVASSDYHNDIRVSDEILAQLSDAYKKIRNTFRFMLGSTGDVEVGFKFNPDTDKVSLDKLEGIDRWALTRLDKLVNGVTNAYENYEFNKVFHDVYNFCVVDMSSFYLDVIKDRLYCEGDDSDKRKASMYVMYTVLNTLVRLVAPILSFVAEEVWRVMPHYSNENAESVFLNDFPVVLGLSEEDEEYKAWDFVYNARLEVNKELEVARNNKVLGKSLEAKVTVYASPDEYDKYVSVGEEKLAEAFIVSAVELKKSNENVTKFTVETASGQKCERCWCISEYVGKYSNKKLCRRCDLLGF